MLRSPQQILHATKYHLEIKSLEKRYSGTKTPTSNNVQVIEVTELNSICKSSALFFYDIQN